MDELQKEAGGMIIDVLHESVDDPNAGDGFYQDMERFFNENGIYGNRQEFMSGVKLVRVYNDNPGYMNEEPPTYILMDEGWQEKAKDILLSGWTCADYGEEADGIIDEMEKELKDADVSKGCALDAPLGLKGVIEPDISAAEALSLSEIAWPEDFNPYGAKLLDELHAIQDGNFDFESEITEKGFVADFDPLDHDEECYDELARKMPNFGPALKEWAEREANGILMTVNGWLEEAGLEGMGEADGLDDARDRIGNGLEALERAGKGGSEYPDYENYHLEVEAEERPEHGRYELSCWFDTKSITVLAKGDEPAKEIDSAFHVRDMEDRPARRETPKA